MARPVLALVVISSLAVAVGLSATFVAAPISHRTRTQEAVRLRAGSPSSQNLDSAPRGASAATTAVAAGAAAVVLGLLVGLVSGPEVASATPRPLPDFSLTRPESLMGVDAANAATKPGQVDFVTRSQIEAVQFPSARKEVQRQQEKLRSIPTKAQRVQKAQAQMQQLAKKLEIPA